MKFKLVSDFNPLGDQPKAIDKLVQGITNHKKSQVLLGITGSGKTFTMANVIAKVQRPTLILAHNKTLAAQLYQEFRHFFPENAVEYFVSYYDYYQPEAYIPRTDTYIEKDMSINDRIDRMRLSATRSLIERDDVIIVASVSCIYGLGVPEYYAQMQIKFEVGKEVRRDDLLLHLIAMHYKRNDFDFIRGNFRVRGDILEIFPAYEEKTAIRIEFFDEEIERISLIDPLTAAVKDVRSQVTLFPGSHFVTPESVKVKAIESIKKELEVRLQEYEKEEKWVEKERIFQRTQYDLEMIKEIGFCKGIENYSRHFSGRAPGQPPPCLIDYFPDDFLFFIDESHQTVPQVRAMYNGDYSRKKSLVEYGFRLPSAFDNRPLKFEEFYERLNQVVYVSATPSNWEIEESSGEIIEQIIRPTGLLDPKIEVRPSDTQVDDCIGEIQKEIKKEGRILVTTLTKRLAEDLSKYLDDVGIQAKYLHSDIDTLERVQIIESLRNKEFDVLVGINLLREGLDIPEVSLVVILDADKEGFLRSETSLLQTCGRAARNKEGRVLMYAMHQTNSMKNAIEVTQRRREIQKAYNKQHHIVPTTTKKQSSLPFPFLEDQQKEHQKKKQLKEEFKPVSKQEIQNKINYYEKEMKKAAKDLNFEEAAHFRDLMNYYMETAMELG